MTTIILVVLAMGLGAECLHLAGELHRERARDAICRVQRDNLKWACAKSDELATEFAIEVSELKAELDTSQEVVGKLSREIEEHTRGEM